MLPTSLDQLSLHIIKTIKDGKKKEFHATLDELQPYDIAKIFENLPDKHHSRFLFFMSPEQVALLVQELGKEYQLKVLSVLGLKKSGEVLDLMDNDDLTLLLSSLSPDKIQELLAGMKSEESKIVQNMMNYPTDSAGRMMTDRFIWIYDNSTVQETVEKMKIFAEYSETINYLYVVSNDKKLVGVVSYRDLILAQPNETIKDIMYNRVISVSSHTDQEEVARLIERYDFLCIPVVDDEKKLLGIVTIDDIIDVVIKEANEDIEKLAATGKSIDFDTKATTAASRRLPWLVLLLFIGLVSGSIIGVFEETLSKVVSLAFFMPMIAGMTGNTGTQSLAVIVRGLSNHDLDKKTFRNLLFRELKVGLIIGLICGFLISGIAYFWMGNVVLGFVVGSSLFLTLVFGTLAGTIIPLLLYKLKIDPAIASGPLITTLNDILSLLIYFGIATFFLTKIL